LHEFHKIVVSPLDYFFFVPCHFTPNLGDATAISTSGASTHYEPKSTCSIYQKTEPKFSAFRRGFPGSNVDRHRIVSR